MFGRLMIAGTHSGVGKTTITVGLIDALRRRGLIVQPFKVGPDYIDPSYHTLASGRPCRNLDTWMLPLNRVKESFFRAAQDADIAVIEGAMGLHDGQGYEDDRGSPAEVAKLLDTPVVVVLDIAKTARSAAAGALGYKDFDKDIRVIGYVLNRAANERHGQGVAAAVENATGLPVFGWLPREAALQVPERHLGLIPTAEQGPWQQFIQSAAEAVSQHVSIDRILALARQVLPLDFAAFRSTTESLLPSAAWSDDRPVIAGACDEAFQFIYQDNLDLLRAAGAEIAFFSPLRDLDLPAGTAGVILSGGFPEIYAEQLALNTSMHEALRNAHRRGLPIYAECGGLMYLTEAITDRQEVKHAMVGLLPGQCVMGSRLTLGYRLARTAGDSWLLHEGETIRGHEFHYSAWEGHPRELPPAYLLLPRSGEGETRSEGARLGSLWASYVHVHFGAMPELASRFVVACRRVAATRSGALASVAAGDLQ
jgi:cobyrinic acid a,c-diamide synthase